MTDAKRLGLILYFAGCAIFLFLAAVFQHSVGYAQLDFEDLYYGSKCLLQHHDPYIPSQILDSFETDHRTLSDNPRAAVAVKSEIALYVNLPTAALLVAPLALLPYNVASMIWLGITISGLLLSAFLIWRAAAEYAPRLAGVLVFVLLVNSAMLPVFGNAAGIVISLCIFAVWSFLTNRLAYFGILGMAISLALKPHDVWLVWLYFLLAGGLLRKRALQSLALTALFALAAVMWMSLSAPHWPREMLNVLQTLSAHGGSNDPGPSSTGGHSIGQIINLQAALSLIRDNPHFYNPAAYLIIGVLIILWTIRTLHRPASIASHWLALATIACLSMLPIYHRAYDARLLLLAIPACAYFWASKNRLRVGALLVALIGIVCTGDLFWIVMIGVINHLHLPPTGTAGFVSIALRSLPASGSLLVAGIFFLYAYWHTPSFASEASGPTLMANR